MKKENFGEVFVVFHSRITCHHLLCERDVEENALYLLLQNARENVSHSAPLWEALVIYFLTKDENFWKCLPFTYCALLSLYLGKFETQRIVFGEPTKLKFAIIIGWLSVKRLTPRDLHLSWPPQITFWGFVWNFTHSKFGVKIKLAEQVIVVRRQSDH